MFFFSGPPIKAFIVCDDEFTLYADGELIGGDKNWATTTVGKTMFNAKP